MIKELRVRISKTLHNRLVKKADGQKRSLAKQTEIILERGFKYKERKGGDE